VNGKTSTALKPPPRAEQPLKRRRPPLTDREAEVLRILRDWWAEKGYGASVRDIAAQMNWSLGTIAGDMRSLRAKGYITQPPYTQRAARPVDLEDGAA
jgi:DNA-binding CsgD family transcriptional regulator